MIQQQFIELAKSIILRGHAEFNSCYCAANKLKAIQDMGNQLEALRQSYCKLSGQPIDMPKFSALLGLEQ
jgi:hypothetical protein